ncbi:hypothetical protein ACFOSD_12430 [Salinispirillum marinum]|uniref:Uncharacterized protein n=2 Tax=Saccharospirillaceae TaxID=255527 RepID=A0ABV8BJG6_9GAMM
MTLRIVFVFLGLLSLGVGATPVTTLQGIYALPVSVVYVQRLGYWRHGLLDGNYRVVVVEEDSRYQRHQMHIQWLCQCETGLVAIRGIDELNVDERFIFTPPTFRRIDDIDTLDFVARDTRTQEDFAVQIRLLGLGEYELLRQRLPDTDRRQVVSPADAPSQ